MQGESAPGGDRLPAASASPAALESSSLLALSSDYAPAFAAIIRALEAAGETVVWADPEAGVVATAIRVAGDFRQTGTRTVVLVSPGNYRHTFVEVAVTVQQRFQTGRPEPWGAPVLDAALSRDVLHRLRRMLALGQEFSSPAQSPQPVTSDRR